MVNAARCFNVTKSQSYCDKTLSVLFLDYRNIRRGRYEPAQQDM